MHKYVIMGPQGCGKGTQAKLLQEKINLIHISVGDMFRWHVQNHTKLGAQVNRLISEGHMVPDKVVETVVRERLQLHDWNYGFILDGFPRNKTQAEFFLESYDIDAVIHIHVPDEVVKERVMARRICVGCGLDYNLIFHRPKVESVCDVCGGELQARSDDTVEALDKRLNDYHSKTKPVLDLFSKKELIHTVDGTRDRADVQVEIRQMLGL